MAGSVELSAPLGDAARGISLDLRTGTHRVFAHVLVRSLLVSVVNYKLWFAVTFWVYLGTRSVLATGIIGGIFLIATASTGVWFGSLVDHHRKQQVMQWSAAGSFVLYACCLELYVMTSAATFRDPASPLLWTFVVLLMLGVIAGGLRGLALPTLVTLLVPEPLRHRGQRAGRDDAWRVVPDHLSDQRAARGLRRHAVGAGAVPRGGRRVNRGRSSGL